MSHDGSFFGAAIYMVGTMDPINKNPQSTPIDPDGLAPKRLRPVPWRELGWDWSHLYIYILYIYNIYYIYILYYIILYMCVYHIHMYYIYILYICIVYIYIYIACVVSSFSSIIHLCHLLWHIPCLQWFRPLWRSLQELLQYLCGLDGEEPARNVENMVIYYLIQCEFAVISWWFHDLMVI